MDWRKDWWRFAVLGLVVVGLIWWRNSKSTEPVSELTPEQVTEERANQFLREAGITVPEGSERANLADVKETGATGVATRKVTPTSTEVTLLAGIPEEAMYVGWVSNDKGEFKRLGRLTDNKGGLSLTYSSKTLEGFDKVVVSKETVLGEKPTDVVLEGSFGQ